MFTTSCYIRKNTLALRKKLEELGYNICFCAEFKDATWLTTFPAENSVYGTGYYRSGDPYKTQEETLAVYENTTFDIDCADNEELFLALAALRDDSDYMQWFCDYSGGNWTLCTEHVLRGSGEWHTEHGMLHKASVKEIIKQFNK